MNKIIREVSNEINRALYEDFANTESSPDIFRKRLNTLESAMRITSTLNAAWEMAVACANLWMPNPSRSGEFIYNSVEYNTVEIFCLCVLKAHKEN